MKRIMSIDLEYDFETRNLNNLKFIPKLLDLFDDYDIKATFFVLGKLIKGNEDLIKEIAKKHEIACHSFSHPFLNKLTYYELEQEIKKSKSELKKLKIKCEGFRAPYFVTHPRLGELLVKHNFKYDSSIASFSLAFRFNNLGLKMKPYKASKNDLRKKGNDIIELPMPNLFLLFQSGLSTSRFFYPFSKTFKMPYLFYFHPCEFLEQKIGKEINFFIRQFYKRNQGKKAWKIFREILDKTDGKWVSCREFIKLKGY